MATFHSLLFALHIVVGSAALVLFWIPMLSKKGQLNHVTFGHYYKNTMYAVAGTGAMMAIIVLLMPYAIHGQAIMASPDPAAALEYTQTMYGFLLYLSLVSYTSTRHGAAVLVARNNRALLRRFQYQAPLWLLLAGGVICLFHGAITGGMLHIVFGLLGVSIALSMLRYVLRKSIKQNQWIIEHIGAMIGSAIGAYTAFIAFGGRTVFSELGAWQIAFWIAPGVAGGIATSIISSRYAKKLGLHQS
ncbi:hypothetical protein [Alteromonas oceanisediminis]|uniref:hypothetical protein n=1 Tax=Alteromonas oceanisediminis TaxID=2836180 RepID=UPI001BD9A832|nr:hypothetical protein [Alteromonas oceanisediminis]MBT0585157.1 hypothetical protein [Alteromonas oceanisediminis]